MSATSSIEWTDKTWNPTRGCSIVSPGCHHCYAMKQAHRFSGPGKAYEGLTKQTKAGPQWTSVVRTVEDALLEPLSWRKPQRVFVNSMSDLFHEDVPDEFIDKVFAVMALAHRHTFQILTKRAERMLQYFADEASRCGRIAEIIQPMRTDERPVGPLPHLDGGEQWWPLQNVWLGVSAEDQQRADERIPLLLQTPAAVRFVSAEPLLGAVDLRDIQPMRGRTQTDEGLKPLIHFAEFDVLRGEMVRDRMGFNCPRVDWVIVGGESGPGARPFDLAWARSIVEQCNSAGVACFVKQLGSKPVEEWTDGPTQHHRLRFRDSKGGDPDEWSEDLRVRQFPVSLRWLYL